MKTNCKHRWVWGTLAGVVVALTIVLYWPALSTPLFYDEDRLILQVPAVQEGDFIAAFRAFPTRGIPFSSFALTHLALGTEAIGWRLSQVFFHLVCAFLLFLVLLRLKVTESLMAALLVTLFFLWHPLAVESALYVWSRATVLYVMVMLGAVHISLFERTGSHFDSREWLALMGWTVLLLVACCCKEAGGLAVFLLVVALAIQRWRWQVWRLFALWILGAGVAITICGSAIRESMSVYLESMGGTLSTSAIVSQVWQQGCSFLIYLRLLMPFRDQYTLVHQIEYGHSWELFVVGWGAILLCGGGIYYTFRRGEKALAVGGLVALAGIIPYMFLPGRAVIEYKAYPLLVGGAFFVFAMVQKLQMSFQSKKHIALFYLAGLLLLGGTVRASYCQIQTWTSDIQVWEQAIRVYPNNVEAKTNLAICYARSKDWRVARQHAAHAIRDMILIRKRSGYPLFHSWALAAVTLGYIDMELGRLSDAEKAFRMALKIDRKYQMAWVHLADVLLRQKKYSHGRKALAQAYRFARDPFEVDETRRVEERFP